MSAGIRRGKVFKDQSPRIQDPSGYQGTKVLVLALPERRRTVVRADVARPAGVEAHLTDVIPAAQVQRVRPVGKAQSALYDHRIQAHPDSVVYTKPIRFQQIARSARYFACTLFISINIKIPSVSKHGMVTCIRKHTYDNLSITKYTMLAI